MRRIAGVILMISASHPMNIAADDLIIDDFSDAQGTSNLGTRWRLVSDQVMGGVSDGRMTDERVDGRGALCLRGRVSLENNGGFLQLSLDLSRDGLLDASTYAGIRLTVRGDGERYNLHLKTADTTRPWQSYRSSFEAGAEWQDILLPFGTFEPYRIDTPFDRSRLRRLGIVAIGRDFTADLCIADVRFSDARTPKN